MTEMVRAKRLGWDETTSVTDTDILDPYDYASDDLEGEHETIEVDTPYLHYTNHLVGGEVADPATIEPLEAVIAAADAATTDAMIALVPTDADAARLASPDGEPADELHLTLWYLGAVADLPPDTPEALVNAVRSMIDNRGMTPVRANGFGLDLWNPNGDTPSVVLAVGDVPYNERDEIDNTLAQVRESVREAWVDGGVAFELPEQYTPWVPHVCLAYSNDVALLDNLLDRIGPITFDRVRLAFAGAVTDVPLDGGARAQEVTTQSRDGATLRAGETIEGVIVPWHTVKDHAGCPSGKPWAVVKNSDGSVAGCHTSEADANAQLAALYANEDAMTDTVELAGRKPSTGTPADRRLKENRKVGAEDETESLALDCPDGMMPHPDTGKCVPPEDVPPADVTAVAKTAPWRGVLVIEGQVTGDGREFGTGEMTWVNPHETVMPLRWNKEDSHGGEARTIAVCVGRIDEVWRDGSKIMGSGVFDLGSVDGREAYRRTKEGFLAGISIDADDISGADVEYVWPEDVTTGRNADGTSDDEDVDILSILFSEPEKIIFHGGRIRAATLCDIPAFVGAFISLDDDVPTEADTITASAIGSHGTSTSDGSWDAGANESRLPSPLPAAKARAAYAWIDAGAVQDGVLPKSACKFIHHEIGADGTVGAANITACSSGIGILHGGRGGANVPAADKHGIYNHLAKHVRDDGGEPPPFTADTLVAHALTEEWRPPAEWFTDPKLNVLVPIMVTDEGRVYGHAAQWGQCHLAYADTCVMPPRESEFPYFLTGELTTNDGVTVPVGQITVGTGHPPLYVGPSVAAEHYDNTGSVVADVTIGNDRHGIWVAGAIRPDADVMRVHKLRASGQVSPDWRRIGGQLRMIALLTVNGSGYQVPRMRARVASGKVEALVAAGMIQLRHAPSENEMIQLGLRALADSIAARTLGTEVH